jgi:hypothetical protein
MGPRLGRRTPLLRSTLDHFLTTLLATLIPCGQHTAAFLNERNALSSGLRLGAAGEPPARDAPCARPTDEVE